jgi:hypothetical protein
VTKIVKTFEYTGKLAIADLPHGVTTMDIYLWGGAGGKGGGDYAGAGADGAAGHYVQATGIDVRAYAGVKKIAVAVGGAGGDGTEGGGAEGGNNGKSLTGYSGGDGGKSGTTGTSGSGGGGGGATTVTMYESGQAIDTIKIGIAGGGGGSGGSGRQSRGGVGANTNSATSNSPGQLGEQGADHNGDGGGGGAGGGGAAGGKGGSGATGDAGGHPGFSGSNLIPSVGSGTGNAAAATESNGSGTVPGKTNLTLSGSEFGDFNGVQLYTNSRAYGATKDKSAKDGKAVVVFNVPAEAYHKVGSDWKVVKEMYFKRPGTGGALSNGWYKIIGGYYKVGGVWTTIFNSDINFKLYSEGFGNPNGGPTSGSTGTGGIPTAVNIPASAPNSDRGNDNGGGSAFVPDNACHADANDGFGQLSVYSHHPNQNYGFYARADTGGAGNGGCFIAGTPITMADGSTKPVEQVDIKDEVAIGGYVFAAGKFLINNLYEYKGIKVSGSHMVREDNQWVRVEDSKLGKSLGTGDHIVYVFGCENRRILIGDTLFTDYFDGFEQEGLKKLGEKYFEEYREHEYKADKTVVDTINKK